jgi:polyisoprenoid-binding protein YceI
VLNRRVLIIVGIIAAAGVLVVGAYAAYILRPPATPSGAITAIPIQATETPASTATEDASLSLAGRFVVAELVQAESEARFLIEEILNNNPKTVIGVTNQVAGQILIDPANPANVQMGPVTVNARTLETDNGFRNRAIQNEILDTGEFEFITFTPKSFLGLPETGDIGQTFTFQIVGDLTIRDEKHEVTFDLSVTVDSETSLHGLGTATISRQQFGLGLIELPPSVASVEDQVIIEIEFVAERVP